jgi:hypothetical protein
MFMRALRDGFTWWWGKLACSLFASILGALNPFFAVAVGLAVWGISGNLPSLMAELPFAIIAGAVLCAASNAWPLSLAALDMQRRAVDGEQVYFREWLPNALRSVRRLFLPSLGLTALYALPAFVLAFGGLFWFFSIGIPFLRYLVAALAAGLYLMLLLSQFYLLPLVVSNPELKAGFALKAGFRLLVAEPFPAFGLFLIDSVLLALLVSGRIFPFLVYYGLSPMLRLALYREVIARYGGGDRPSETTVDSGAAAEKSAWATLMRRRGEGGGK